MNKLIIGAVTVMLFPATLCAQTAAATQPQQRVTTATSQASSVKSLAAVLTNISANRESASFTKEQRESLSAKIMALLESGPSPDAALIDVLIGHFDTALSRTTMSRDDLMTLVNGLYSVMNSSTLSKDELDLAIGDIESSLLRASVAKKDVDAVVQDLKAIATQVRSAT